MTELANLNRKQPSASAELRAGVFRMALVIGSSLTVLIAMPGWLRNLERSHSDSASENAASVLEQHLSGSAVVSAAVVITKEDLTHQALADSLGKRYRVSKDALERFIRLAYSAGQMTKLDPLLILAVMAVESNFNPIAESVMGAKGLMQIIPEYHQDKLTAPRGSELNVLDPETNILAGAKVLREYATRTGEDLVAALRLYGGTGPNVSPYPAKVLSERDRLQQTLRQALDSRGVSASAPGQRP